MAGYSTGKRQAARREPTGSVAPIALLSERLVGDVDIGRRLMVAPPLRRHRRDGSMYCTAKKGRHFKADI